MCTFRSMLIALTIAMPTIAAEKLSRIEVAKRGKAAIAFVYTTSTSSSRFGRGGFGQPRGAGRGGRVGGGRFGRSSRSIRTGATAICIHPSGLFLSQAITPSRGSVSPPRIMIYTGENDEKTVSAQIVREDAKAGLTLLWAPEVKDHPAIKLGTIDEVSKGMEVISCGYSSTIPRTSAPPVILKPTTLANIRQGTKDPILNEAPPTLGNLLLNRSGKLVGVVNNASARGTPLYGVSVGTIREFLSEPVLLIDRPTTLTPEKMHEPALFRILKIAPTKSTPLSLGELELQIYVAGESQPRALKLKSEQGSYAIKVAPIPKPKTAPKLQMSVEFDDGRVAGLIADQTLKIGKQSLQLSSIRQITRKEDKVEIALNQGNPLSIEPSALPRVALHVAGESWKISLQKAKSVSVSLPPPPAWVHCKIVAQGKEVKPLWEERMVVRVNQPLPSRDRSSTLARLAQMLMERGDRNGNGQLDPGEVTPALARFDRNGDGIITKAELDSYVRSRFDSGSRGGSGEASRFGRGSRR